MKENRKAANSINKAKKAMEEAMHDFEKAGQDKEAAQMWEMILRLEKWQIKHC